MKLQKIRLKYTTMLLLLAAILPAQSLRLKSPDSLVVAADRPGAYLASLYDKNVGMVVNHSSALKDGKHLVDFLLENKIKVKKIFSPEHGFRGTASAGAKVESGKDAKTGLPVISLYGNHKKPTAADLEGLDILIFDIQDVGARFYTYISTLSYVMEAAAEHKVKVMVLDRPNPHGYYIDGPVLELKHKSFVGMHPVPIIHGMTVGEYARMVNGEGWLQGSVQCDLEVIPCRNYDHNTAYELPIKPSPNLPNRLAVNLYPSLCLFEGTPVSIGRGTDYPFQLIGAPWFKEFGFSFTPEDRPGAANPPYEGVECKGFVLQDFADSYMDGLGEIYLYWLVESYRMAPDKSKFFKPFFTLLAGTTKLQEQIVQGLTAEEIRASWQDDLRAFQQIRRKYLIYSDY
ncbi:DUF1343 domain-containing protein [Croceimicrobium hydrocarbonivorans]|uniref:DUF1343 domain-containing protein n=2 Tax=Croceimicrobium hydrocarbonivorans TaxID=2761580 RepID=A0A7H0VF79_9FLAO|nr:DUF1343 domain-containing protein [Croceimicrobium hydrocarbonivorans]